MLVKQMILREDSNNIDVRMVLVERYTMRFDFLTAPQNSRYNLLYKMYTQKISR